MKQLNYKIHTGKDKTWYDESGTGIPYNRTTRSERLKERKAGKIVRDALRINKELREFKKYVKEASEEVYRAVMEENGGRKNSKGNYIWYNFDRSVKIEVNINEPIEFDDIMIQAAKEKFDEFLEKNITSKNAFAKELVLQAFETRNGKLDTKRVLNLVRYKDKVRDELFSEAVELINKAVRRKPSRMYFRVWVKDNSGKYRAIDLNFSSVEIDETEAIAHKTK